MSFRVKLSADAIADLDRLFDFILERELARDDGDLTLAQRAIDATTDALDRLRRSPFIYRRAGTGPFLRELLIPFGGSGYVSLFEIEDASTVTILAVRQELEDDYH